MTTKKKKLPAELVKQLKFVYTEDPDYKTYYISGARGGSQGPYHFQMEFFVDNVRRNVEEEIRIAGKRTITKTSYDEETTIIDRLILFKLMMPYQTAKEIADWLTKRLGEYEEAVKLAKAEAEKGG